MVNRPRGGHVSPRIPSARLLAPPDRVDSWSSSQCTLTDHSLTCIPGFCEFLHFYTVSSVKGFTNRSLLAISNFQIVLSNTDTRKYPFHLLVATSNYVSGFWIPFHGRFEGTCGIFFAEQRVRTSANMESIVSSSRIQHLAIDGPVTALHIPNKDLCYLVMA